MALPATLPFVHAGTPQATGGPAALDAALAFGGAALVQAVLDHEAARLRALASVGHVPAVLAESVANTCKVELFDADRLVRESVRLELQSLGTTECVTLAALRETVQLFNPLAAERVLQTGPLEALHHNVLARLTTHWLHDLTAAVRALADQFGPLSTEGAALQQALQRIDACATETLCLHPATLVPEPAAASAMAPTAMPTLGPARQHMAQALGLHLGASGLVHPVTPPVSATADSWAHLAQALGLLAVALGRLAAGLPDHLHGRWRDALRSHARRMPLEVAAWTAEITQPGEALRHRTDPALVAVFWSQLCPRWLHLAERITQGVRGLTTVVSARSTA